MPERIQRKRTAGWRMPENTVYVGRPTRWGNPFGYQQPAGLARVPAALDSSEWEYEGRISADGARHDYHHPDGQITVCHVRYMTRAETVESYERLITGNLSPAMISAGFRLDRRKVTPEGVRHELAGKDLACWCPLDQPCHADVLLKIAAGADTDA